MSHLAIFYHVDRTRSYLEQGGLLQNRNYAPRHYTADQITALRADFPFGLSKHGAVYLDRNTESDELAFREWFLEYFRRQHHPNIPSRFSCYFACRTLEDANRLKSGGGLKDQNWKNAAIWSVEAESVFSGDMNWLTPDFALVANHRTQAYWEQIASPSPLWEHLLVPPISVVEQLA
jgi:Protein of unknown function (DUF2441)